MSASPGSRLSDDLYSLYIAGLGWLILPFYGDQLSEVLPSDLETINPGVDIAVLVAVVGAIWFGHRGGPLMVSRAGVLHELASGASRRQMLYPRFLRQAIARAAIAAVVATVVLALSVPGEYEVGSSLTISAVAFLGAGLATGQSMLWHLVFSTEEARQPWFVAASLAAPVALVVVVLRSASFSDPWGLLVLLLATFASTSLAIAALEWAPIERLWSRARALETMRSSMQSVDFQRLLLDMRQANDRPRVAGRPIARAWMPTPVWRQVAALQHGLSGQVTRLVLACCAIVAMLEYGNPSNGVVVIGIAGCVALVGFDLAVPIASTVDQIPFIVHYRHGSARVLQGQMLTAVVLAMIIAGAVSSRQWTNNSNVAVGTLLIFLVGTLSALMQARLGSPDVAKWASMLGGTGLGPILWARALFGPLLLFVATVSISHQYYRPDEFGSAWGQLTLLVTFVLVGVTMHPMEKSLR